MPKHCSLEWDPLWDWQHNTKMLCGIPRPRILRVIRGHVKVSIFFTHF
jgi:hypothetical protein